MANKAAILALLHDPPPPYTLEEMMAAAKAAAEAGEEAETKALAVENKVTIIMQSNSALTSMVLKFVHL